jgi:phosphosulfolactate phosphohydrolase-like enzyme
MVGSGDSVIAGYAARERGAREAAREGVAIVVVDAFRAGTTIAVLVRKGARVIPVASIKDAAAHAGADELATGAYGERVAVIGCGWEGRRASEDESVAGAILYRLRE